MAFDSFGAGALDFELKLELLDLQQRWIGKRQGLNLFGLRGDLSGIEAGFLGLLLLLVSHYRRRGLLDPIVQKIGVTDLHTLEYQM